MNTRFATILFAGLCLAGCAQNQEPPLVFIQAHSFGVVASAGTTSQGAELTVGYHDLDIAVVPVTVLDKDGTVVPLKSFTSGGTPCTSATAGVPCNNAGLTDALSVLGQFDSTTSASTPSVGFGTFFATGQAAAIVAQGFQAKLGK